MKVLAINSYAGSLILGAKARGDELVGSYENKGYGLPIQRENFPDLNFIAKQEDWPEQDLSGTVVIGHPPCSAFSSQNRGGAHVRGAETDAFACTVNLLRYAMRNRARAIAVESVVGALEGGRAVHDRIAREYGYQPYRVLLNACTLGVPQFRPRFWIVFLPGAARPATFVMEFKKKTVGQVVANSEGKVLTDVAWVRKVTEEQLGRLRLLLEASEVEELLATPGSVVRNLPKVLRAEDAERVRELYAMGHNFTSHSMVVLNKNGFAPTLLAGSWWHLGDRAVAAEEYKEIMGFPRDYIFPGKYYQDRMREFLSRGVCPQTATWVLDQVERNLDNRSPVYKTPEVRTIWPGEIADFRVARKTYKEARA